MLDRFRDPYRRLRLAGWIEGATLLLLLFVAVPLKRVFGIPEATRVVGAVHGLAFVAYLVVLADTAAGAAWRLREVALAFGAALVPVGTFVHSRRLARAEAAQAAAAPPLIHTEAAR